MLRRLRSQLNYSNVVASLALFVALGGVSYAAVKLPRNSVGSRAIKKNAVTGAKVKDSSLTGADIRNSSLTAADFAGSVTGPAGPQGSAGVAGAPGPSDAYASHVPGGVNSSSTEADLTSVSVPAGSYVVTAKLYGLRQGEGTTDLLCSLWNGSEQLDFTHADPNNPADQPYVQLPLEGFATVTGPATFRLACSGSGGVIRMYGITLVALKVGTLHS